MIRPMVTLRKHVVKGITYGTYLTVPVASPLDLRTIEEWMFLGRQGNQILIALKTPSEIINLRAMNEALPFAEWVTTARGRWSRERDEAANRWPGLTIYIPKGFKVPIGRHRADVVNYEDLAPRFGKGDLVVLVLPA